MNRKIRINIMLPVMLLFIATSCAVTDIDKTADFNKYKTFSWGAADIKVENPVYNSDLITKNVKATIAAEFAKRGIRYNKENADFVVNYHTYTEKREEQNWNNGHYGYFPMRFYPFGFYGFPYAYGPYGYGGSPRIRQYTEGTLIIDIADKATNEVVWRGVVSGDVDNVGKLQKQIQKGIKAIMKKYPVPATDQQILLPDQQPVS